MSFLLALDQSTSATKALLFDFAGQLVDSEAVPHEQHYPQPSWVEHDAEEIYANLLQGVHRLLDRHADKRDAVAGLAITNQRETALLFEKTTGQPLCRAMVWQCRRSTELCQQLREAGHEQLIEQRTGLKLDPYFSASKLLWLRRQHSELAHRLDAGTALVGTIDTYLIYRLTRAEVFATDSTNASRTMLMGLEQRVWDNRLCELFEVPRHSLAEIRPSSADYGETDFAGLLPRPIPIVGVMGDSQAALFSQRCFQPGEMKATLGTGTSVLLNVGSKLQLPSNGVVAALAWEHAGVPTYAWEGLIHYSAATVAWLRDQLGLIRSAEETEQLAQSVADTQGVYLVPAFSGLGVPYWKPDARAAILGMTAATNRAHVARAALEAIAYQICDAMGALAASGIEPQRIRADGGPTRNRFLMQFIADMTQLEVAASSVAQMSALGAVMAGLLQLKVVDSLLDLAALPQSTTTYTPAMPRARAEKLVAGWNAAVHRIIAPAT